MVMAILCLFVLIIGEDVAHSLFFWIHGKRHESKHGFLTANAGNFGGFVENKKQSKLIRKTLSTVI